MAKRRIEWSRNAEIQLQEILEYFAERNKSDRYSRKLYKQFKSELQLVAKKPEIGIKTKLKNIRGLVVDAYILFYEIFEDRIVVLKVWDCRQSPDKLNILR